MKRLTASLIAGSALLLSACSAGYDRADTINDLVTEGIDEPTATCIVDGMEDKIGVDRLGERGDPTPEETELIEQVTIDCVLGS